MPLPLRTLARRFRCLLLPVVLLTAPLSPAADSPYGLPMSTIFKGRERFDALVAQAGQWKTLPIGERTAAIGRVLCGTPYKSFTLEIDDRIEAPSVNLYGLDCWTFFEVSLAFARMLDEPRENWTPVTLLKYIELDRYRDGDCNGSYLSRLHYLEDWLGDNRRRGLVEDLTRNLGAIPGANSAREMTVAWRSYRYMRNNPDLRAGIARMEQRVGATPLYYIPNSKVPAIEGKLKSGDIIGIVSRDGKGVATSHVGLAKRTDDGVLRFMHASSPRNHGKVVLDQRLSSYLKEFSSHVGILVARPLK